MKNSFKNLILTLSILLTSCNFDVNDEQKYSWKSASIGNYKYITAYFNQAILIIDLEVNNYGETEDIITNNYGDFIIVYDSDTIILGQKSVSHKYFIGKNERSILQLPTTILRDDKKYEEFLFILENGNLFKKSIINDGKSYILIEKNGKFFINEGGKEGNIVW